MRASLTLATCERKHSSERCFSAPPDGGNHVREGSTVRVRQRAFDVLLLGHPFRCRFWQRHLRRMSRGVHSVDAAQVILEEVDRVAGAAHLFRVGGATSRGDGCGSDYGPAQYAFSINLS